MVVVKVGGQRGRVLAQIEERNQKLRKKQELQYTKEIYKKFDAVRSGQRLPHLRSWQQQFLLVPLSRPSSA